MESTNQIENDTAEVVKAELSETSEQTFPSADQCTDLPLQEASSQPSDDKKTAQPETADETEHQQPVMQRAFDTRLSSYIYAVGILKPTFPNQGLKQAYEAAARKLDISEFDYSKVLGHQDPKTGFRPYFYLAEQIEWVLSIHDEDCYLLQPRTRFELLGFLDAIAPNENSLLPTYATAVGERLAPTESSGVEKIVCDHVYSFTLDGLHEQLTNATDASSQVIRNVLTKLEAAPNKGITNEDRAKNYLAFRYPDIYSHSHALASGKAMESDATLDKVVATKLDVASPHAIIDLMFIYQSNSSKQETYYHCSVDVTNQYPFINSPIKRFDPYQAMLG